MKNNLNQLNEIINGIKDVDSEAIKKAEDRMTSLAKPLKSLGKLEVDEEEKESK